MISYGVIREIKKIHLVNWDNVCQSKKGSGLGVRKSKTMNKALLAKSAWHINSAKKGLLADIL